MKSIKTISFFMIFALGLMPLMALTTQAAISPTQILDSAGDISWYDYSGDYVAYTNSPHPAKEVNLYNYKTDTVINIQEGGNPTLLVAIDGNTVLYKTYDLVSTPDKNGKIMVYDIPSGSRTQFDTYLTYFSIQVDIGGNHVMYEKIDSVLNEHFVYVKTLSGTTVWQSSNMISESTNSFNINNGYAMFCADRVHIYDITADNHFTISVASDAFMAQGVDTDGTTIIFYEGGDYPNEFERLVTYNIASGARNSFAAPSHTSTYKIDNGKIYYIDTTFNADGSRTSHLYWMNIDGTGVEQVSDTPVGGHLIVENGKAIVRDPNDQSKLWLFDTASQRSYWYVDGTVANPGDGTSPDKAFRTIQAAIDAAGKNDEIWLKKGTYDLSSPVNVDKAVAIYGGFTGGETQRDQRDLSGNVTTIDGQDSVYHCFYVTADATIDGLTITGGNADGDWPDSSGGGIYNYESSPTITNCTFSGNSAIWGGGISNYESSPTITNCTFSGNSADAGGGGIDNDNSSPTITNCTFTGNSVDGCGGGIDNFVNSSPTITNCTFTGNSANYGGGIDNFLNSSPTITNCTFSGNSAQWGGGIFNDNASPTITNCILWGDTATTDGPEIHNYDTSFPIVTYCDVQGGYVGEGNINVDPLFVDPSNNDFHLQATSPCIDKGNNSAPEIPNTDFEADPRIVDGDSDGTATVDMGIDEYTFVDTDSDGLSDNWEMTYFGDLSQGPNGDYDGDGATNLEEYQAGTNPANNPPTADAGPDQTVDEGDTVTLDGSNSSDPDDGIASYLWTQTAGPSINLSDATSSKPSFTATSGGILQFELKVTDKGGLHNTDTVVIKASSFAADIDLTMDCHTTPVSPGVSHAVTIGIDTKGLTVGALDFTITFNPSHLTPTGLSAIGMAQGASVMASNQGAGQYRVGLAHVPGLTGTGDIVKIDLDVNPTLTTPLTTEVGISPDASACDDMGSELTSVGLAAGTCTITIDTKEQGDIHPDGDVAPLGDRDGTVNVGDALVCLRFALGLETPTQEDTAHGDVAPLDINGQPDPDGNITVGDALVILRKALGLVSWTISKDTHTIDSAGGSINLSNGATLTIPPNSAATPVEVLFTETPTPAHIGEEVIKAYAFATDSELLTSDFTLPVETNDVTSGEDLLIVHMQRQIGPADPIDFTYDPSANTVSFSLHNNWTFQNIPGPAKNRYMNGNRNSNTPQENNKDNTLLVIKRSPYPTVTGKSGPIQMPYFEQCNAGTCWANSGKMLQKGLYPGYLGAGFTYEVFQFMKMLNLGLEDGLYWDSKYSQFADVIGIGKGKAIKWEEYYSFSSALKEIIEQLNRGNPVIFTRLDHVVLVVGYENDIAGDLYLIQHNPKNIGTIGGLYQEQKWEDIATLWNWQDIIALTWAADIPDPNRALQSINLPGQDDNDNLYFLGRKTDSDPSISLHLKFDETSIDGYRWQKSGSAPVENTNHFPKNVNQLLFQMPVYNADLHNSANVKFGIKVYEKDKPSNAAIFTKDIVIPPKNRYQSRAKEKLDLTSVRLNLDAESECVLYITLEKGTERTTSIPIDNFFLQPIKMEITVSIPGAPTGDSGNYTIVADGTSTDIIASVKDVDGENVADGTQVEFETTGGTLSAANATTTNGEATVTLTSPTTIGTADITATIKEINGSTVGEISGSTKVDFIAGPVATITLSANPNTLPADGTSTSTIQVTAKDINGNPVADSSIGLTVSSGSLSAASAKTDSSGVVSVIYTTPGSAPSGGSSTITATTNNITATTVITINPAPSWEGWPAPQWCPQTGPAGCQQRITDPSGNPDEVYCVYHENGYIKFEKPKKDFDYNGIYKEYYESGQLRYETPYVDDKKNGIQKEYYESGQLKTETPYIDDAPKGMYREYYKNGQVKRETPYSYTSFYCIIGIEKTYYESGKLGSEMPYVNCKKEGIYQEYFESGQIRRLYPYVDGKLNGNAETYSEEGKLIECKIYSGGMPTGQSCMP